MTIHWPWVKQKARIVWIDLGDLGDLVHPEGPHEQWQDHGLGLLRTIMHQAGIPTDVVSTRAVTSWDQLKAQVAGYDIALMNVRSYTFPSGRKAAQVFKEVNPHGLVMAGGMHATVAADEMLEAPEFDKICQGPGENIIVDLVRDTLDETPPELVSDLMETGICLAGGGGLLKGIAERIAEETHIRAWVAQDPLTCVARGAGMVLENLEVLRPTLSSDDRRHPGGSAS